MSHVAYIGLGSNLDLPIAHLEYAVDRIGQSDQVTIVSLSSFYRTAPIGPQDQDDYINAVLQIHTDLSPQALLSFLQQIEAERGRNRDKERRWGQRTLDLDILLYGVLNVQEENLEIPHPRLHERAFVLYPLAEISPEIEIPNQKPLLELMKACADQAIEKIHVG